MNRLTPEPDRKPDHQLPGPVQLCDEDRARIDRLTAALEAHAPEQPDAEPTGKCTCTFPGGAHAPGCFWHRSASTCRIVTTIDEGRITRADLIVDDGKDVPPEWRSITGEKIYEAIMAAYSDEAPRCARCARCREPLANVERIIPVRWHASDVKMCGLCAIAEGLY